MHQFMRISTISQSIIDNKEKHKLPFFPTLKNIASMMCVSFQRIQTFLKILPLNSFFFDSLDRCDSDISNAL